MDIVSALFCENFDMRQAPGPSTRIDMRGVFFSMAAPTPAPVTIEPHLIVLIRCRADEPGDGVLEVVFRAPGDAADPGDLSIEPRARNVSPFTVEPGKFTYRLVRAELTFEDHSTIEAHCRIGYGPWTTVPLTLLPPV
jgi:hypothetical protein